MKITDIIEILRNDNTSYLWDLPKPKWEAIEFLHKSYKATKREKNLINRIKKINKI